VAATAAAAVAVAAWADTAAAGVASMAADVDLMAAAVVSTTAREASMVVGADLRAIVGSMVGVASTEHVDWMGRVAWTMAADSATSTADAS
jgi:hypothetical protein